MLNANELRVGNFFNSTVETPWSHGNGWKSVYSISQSGVNEWQDMGAFGKCKYEEMLPIPLTPEILEKCGWFKSTIDHKFDAFRRMTAFVSEGKIINPLGFEVKYLHQLQNLYFALTGEELNINL